MKIALRVTLVGLFALLVTPAFGWNLPAKQVNALSYLKSGEIRFTLFSSGSTGSEFLCRTSPNSQWFRISPCGSGSPECLAAVNRMASTLLAAKLAGKAVHVQRSGCDVTEVALKP